ncbi:MAG TPA: hypothetical protein PKL46_10385 [Aquabacterium sp.]|nr:hypothetical protein [Aquabacterium sp.]
MKILIIGFLCLLAIVFVAGVLKGGRQEGGSQVLAFLKFLIIAIVATVIAVALIMQL